VPEVQHALICFFVELVVNFWYVLSLNINIFSFTTFKRTTREVDLSDAWSFNLYSAYVRCIRHLTAAVGGLCKPCSPPQQLCIPKYMLLCILRSINVTLKVNEVVWPRCCVCCQMADDWLLMSSTTSTALNSTSIDTAGTDTASGPRWRFLPLVAVPLWILVGNSLVLLAVARQRSLRTLSNSVIASLAFADFLLAALVVPLGVYQLVCCQSVLFCHHHHLIQCKRGVILSSVRPSVRPSVYHTHTPYQFAWPFSCHEMRPFIASFYII